MPSVEISSMRCGKLGYWLRLAKTMLDEETALKASMTAERRRILQMKKICLMKNVIAEEGYEDATLADDLAKGFDLVGQAPMSNVLPPTLVSVEELRRTSSKSNIALQHMTRSCGSTEEELALWEKTEKEVKNGWLRGPIPWAKLPEHATVSRRFPINQSGKIRPIDDYSQSQINSAVTIQEQATVDGPDVICALALYLMQCLASCGKNASLVGRSPGLASAYRQLPVAETSLEFAFLAVYNPGTKSASLFQQLA